MFRDDDETMLSFAASWLLAAASVVLVPAACAGIAVWLHIGRAALRAMGGH